MSQTFSIACHDCKKHLWIAQVGHKGRGYLYSTPEHSRAQYLFFMEHRGHRLEFNENCESDIAEYDEVLLGSED